MVSLPTWLLLEVRMLQTEKDILYSETCLNQTLSKSKTCLNQTLSKLKTCLNQTLSKSKNLSKPNPE